MSVIIDKEISFLTSSSTTQGAVNKNSQGSRFDVILEKPLSIPREAINVRVALQSATIWWSINNISASLGNNKMYIDGQDTSDVTTSYVVTIPDGLYDLSGLESAILTSLANQGAKTDPLPLINLIPDPNTQKVEIEFNYATSSVDFTQSDTPRLLLGFDSQVLGTYATIPQVVLADNIASFNQINYFKIGTSIVSKGLPTNGKYNQTLSSIQIDVQPASQINFQPTSIIYLDGDHLKGNHLTTFSVWLTDDQNRLVDTNSEDFSATIIIKYQMPYVIRNG